MITEREGAAIVHDWVVVIQPGHATRVVVAALAPLGAALVISDIAESSVAQGFIALVLLGGPAVFFAARVYRVSVEVRDGKVFVRGLLWSRTIPRNSVWRVTDYPALRWTDAAGRKRWTPLTMFGTGLGVLRSVVAYNTAQLVRLRKALGLKSN